MAGAYVVELPSTAKTNIKNGVDTMIVWGEDATAAKELAKAAHDGGASDAAWAAATATAAAAGTDLEGWRLRIKVGTIVDVTVTGAAAATVDDIGDLMVIALNATTPIANSAYATPALEISSIADGIGDEAVEAWFLPPLAVAGCDWEDDTVSVTGFLGAIVDEGIAGAALTIQLVPGDAIPALLARVQSS